LTRLWRYGAHETRARLQDRRLDSVFSESSHGRFPLMAATMPRMCLTQTAMHSSQPSRRTSARSFAQSVSLQPIGVAGLVAGRTLVAGAGEVIVSPSAVS